MHRNLLLTPLLALALASACGGEGQRSGGGLEDLAVENQSPPRDDQQAPPSSDQPPPAEPRPEAGNSCESLCEAAQGYCPMGGASEFVGMTECVEGCRGTINQFAQCSSEYLGVLRCIVQRGLIDCSVGEIDDDAVSIVCAREVNTFSECVGFVEDEEEQAQ